MWFDLEEDPIRAAARKRVELTHRVCLGSARGEGNATSSPEDWTFTRSWDHTLGAPTIEKRYVEPGPAAALEGFPDTPEEHLGRIQRAVGPALAKKYRGGQKNNGGCLSQKPAMLAHAEEEAIDQITYLCTLREQIERAAAELADHVSEERMEGSRCDERIERAFAILLAILERPD